ncbi:MAG: DegV family protein [Clostridia bacterium]|nr:DegV family protein [Clostridia bacterium]
MLKYKVCADASADIPAEVAKRYSIHTLGIPVTVGEESYISGVKLDNNTFYQLMEDCDTIPITSQITPYEFNELYKAEWADGTEHLLIFLLNSKGSATYANAVGSLDKFFEHHPDAKDAISIHILDGGSYTMGFGYAAVLAAQKLEMGMDVGEVLELVKGQLQRQAILFGMYTLKYAGKSGRIPSAAVFVGETLGIKPIMRVFDHQIITAGKARGEKKLVREVVKMTLADMQPGTPYCVGYGSDTAARDEMIEEATRKIGYPPVYLFQVGPAISANTGARVVGIVYEAK